MVIDFSADQHGRVGAVFVWMSCLVCQSVASVPSLVASLYVSL